jgi:O-6-methylguanine DNA methyltransferase
MKTLFYIKMNTQIGPLLLTSSDKGLVHIALPHQSGRDRLKEIKHAFPDCTLMEDGGKNREAVRQIEEYFRGVRTTFSLDLDLRGTDFQKKVWKALMKVPYGWTRSYGQIARDIGHPRAFRAVGGACHKNPIPLVIPCHRIIGSDGSMTGFGGGISLKEKLLDLEKKRVKIKDKG